MRLEYKGKVVLKKNVAVNKSECPQKKEKNCGANFSCKLPFLFARKAAMCYNKLYMALFSFAKGDCDER